MPNDSFLAQTKPPSNANNIETKPASNAEKANALAPGLSFQSGWFQFVASFSASHPIIAAGAPETSRPTRTVKNSLSTAPVSHAGTSFPSAEIRTLPGVPSELRRNLRNSRVTMPPTTREKSNPIVHCIMFPVLPLRHLTIACEVLGEKAIGAFSPTHSPYLGHGVHSGIQGMSKERAGGRTQTARVITHCTSKSNGYPAHHPPSFQWAGGVADPNCARRASTLSSRASMNNLECALREQAGQPCHRSAPPS